MYRLYSRILFLVCLALLPSLSWAIVSDNPPTVPSAKNVPLGKSTSVSFVWRVTDTSSPGFVVTISSNSGQFCVGTVFVCTTLRTVSKRLSKTYTSTGTPTTFSIAESILVPQAVIDQAKKLGFSTVLYRRSWTPGGTFPNGAITLNITGSAATGFSINRQSMRFDDNSIVKLLNEKESLKAKADVAYNGTGQLQGNWEVAGPGSTSGKAIFRNLLTVRKYLGSGDKRTLVSPPLPSDRVGSYMVRLRITFPAPGFETPVIRYYVGTPGTQILPPQTMRLGNPADRSWLSKDTHFNWQGIKGAKHYRLEIYNKPPSIDAESTTSNAGDDQTTKKPIRLQGSPVAGMILPADALQTELPDSARTRLKSGSWYYWRVIAVDKAGKLVGISPIREMRVP
ncbi:MAG: hypothetical protein BMS9Abin11_1429 [Gammaproteobacteria bacterium]|nr:MAG: hypothetical protein BMS9Abin11_1429 [Gammaproteobacteria bacterium]